MSSDRQGSRPQSRVSAIEISVVIGNGYTIPLNLEITIACPVSGVRKHYELYTEVVIFISGHIAMDTGR